MNILRSVDDVPNNIRPTVLYIFSIFNEIYLVGGAVRDAIMQMPTRDLDFTTPLPVHEVKKILSSNDIVTRDVGIDYGTVSFDLVGFDIQITTFREEYYRPNSRKPLISASPDIDSDLSRRDFSINSIAISNEEVIDPYDGIGDIGKKIIRVIGDSDIKFKDDPLRILRAFRFVAQLGFNIDDNTLQSAISLRSNLGIVSIERVGIELQKLMAGNYWDDALSEIADARILNSLMNILGVNFSISSEDILHELSNYTAEELRLMDITNRWAILINSLDFARSAAGVDSVDRQTLADKLLTAFQLKRIDRDAISSRLSTETSSRLENRYRDDPSTEELLKEGNTQKKRNDPRWMISLATYHTTVGKEAITKSQYKKARDNLEKALSISQENYNYILRTFADRPEEKRDKLKGLSARTRDRLRYCMLAEIFDDKLYGKYTSSKSIINFLIKKYKHSNVSLSDLRSTSEYVLASVYRRNPHPLPLEPFLDYLSRGDLLMDDDTKNRYVRGVIEDKIRDKSTPPTEKASLFLQKAQMAKDIAEIGVDLGFEYYDPYIDYLFNSMISTDSMNTFNKLYDEFVDNANEYLKLSDNWGRLYDGRRNMYLTSASTLIHAIQISDSVEMRLKISKRVVEDYQEARSTKNSMRYKIYVDWFSFANKLFDTKPSKMELQELAIFAAKLDSIKYEDEDEGYLSQYRPDIVRKRALLKDASLVIGSLAEVSRVDTSKPDDEVLSSLRILHQSGLIDSKNLFKALKNYLASIEKEVDSIDKVDIPEKTLKRDIDDADEINNLLTGESETLEYKSTWQFDIVAHRYKNVKENNPDLKHEVVKNIAGMMNKHGGVLLVGVEDNGTICGLEEGDYLMQSNPDHKKKLDNIQQDMRNDIINRLGIETQARISISTLSLKTAEVGQRTIIRINIPKAAHDPVLYTDSTGKEFYYVRTGTSTDDAGIRAYSEAVRSR